MLMLTFGAEIWLQPMGQAALQRPAGSNTDTFPGRLKLTFSLPSDKCCTFCSLTNCSAETNKLCFPRSITQKTFTSFCRRAAELHSASISHALFHKDIHQACSPSTHVQPSRWQLIKGTTCTAQPACQGCQSSARRDNDLTITGLIGIPRTFLVSSSL